MWKSVIKYYVRSDCGCVCEREIIAARPSTDVFTFQGHPEGNARASHIDTYTETIPVEDKCMTSARAP